MAAKLTDELVEKLLLADSPTVSNAIETLHVRSRRDGYMGPQIQCRFPDLGAVVGTAVTCTIVDYESDFPPDPKERLTWLEAIADADEPVICVVQDRCYQKGWSSHWGEIVGTQVQVLGAVGIVTDGAVRDLEALHKMGMNVWSESVVVSHGHIDVGEAQIPVDVGGLIVQPGDILHADLNGVVSIPRDILSRLPDAIQQILDSERKTIEDLRKNGYDFETHRKTIQH